MNVSRRFVKAISTVLFALPVAIAIFGVMLGGGLVTEAVAAAVFGAGPGVTYWRLRNGDPDDGYVQIAAGWSMSDRMNLTIANLISAVCAAFATFIEAGGATVGSRILFIFAFTLAVFCGLVAYMTMSAPDRLANTQAKAPSSRRRIE